LSARVPPRPASGCARRFHGSVAPFSTAAARRASADPVRATGVGDAVADSEG
jgi:hypothetical protein